MISRLSIILCSALLLTACGEDENASSAGQEAIRGLKTVLVEDQQQTTSRRFPSVLQPAEVTTLSFETAGKLGSVDLSVGQTFNEGDVLAQLDRTALTLQLDASKATAEQARINAENAASTFERLNTLLERGVTTKAQVDDARANMQATAAQFAQTQKQAESAEENLSKTDLMAPYDGIINSVEVESFANTSLGAPIATIYKADSFEASFSVSYTVSQRLVVGKAVSVRLADNPDVVLPGIISELGSRADTVSSFPLVISLSETRPELKAGMAIEVSIEFAVPTGNGFLLPLTVLPLDGQLDPDAGPENPTGTTVFVFDEATSTVKKRDITIGGVRENQLIIIDGLVIGDRVASAGTSFLRDGQKVVLLTDSQ